MKAIVNIIFPFLLINLLINNSCSSQKEEFIPQQVVNIYIPTQKNIESFTVSKAEQKQIYYKDNEIGNRTIIGTNINEKEIRTSVELYGSYLSANNNTRLISLYTENSNVPLLDDMTITSRNLGREESISILSSFSISFDGIYYFMNKVLYKHIDGEETYERFVYVMNKNEDDRLLFTTEINDPKLEDILNVFYQMKPDIALILFSKKNIKTQNLPSSGNKRLDEIIQQEVRNFTIQGNRNLDRFLSTVESWEQEKKKGLLTYFFEQI